MEQASTQEPLPDDEIVLQMEEAIVRRLRAMYHQPSAYCGPTDGCIWGSGTRSPPAWGRRCSPHRAG